MCLFVKVVKKRENRQGKLIRESEREEKERKRERETERQRQRDRETESVRLKFLL